MQDLTVILTQLAQSWRKKARQNICYVPKQKKGSSWCDPLNYKSASLIHILSAHTFQEEDTASKHEYDAPRCS